jgi:hypothetical protein
MGKASTIDGACHLLKREYQMRIRITVLFAAAILLGLTLPAAAPASSLVITYPKDNMHVSGEVVEITGTGADPKGQLEVSVLTNTWYPQDGTASINADGSWSYAPCSLSGKGKYNNHTIKVTIIKNGKRGASASVHGIVRD